MLQVRNLQNCNKAVLITRTAFVRQGMLLPGKKKQGPMEEIGPCYQKGDHLRIIAKSQANAGIIALFA